MASENRGSEVTCPELQGVELGVEPRKQGHVLLATWLFKADPLLSISPGTAANLPWSSQAAGPPGGGTHREGTANKLLVEVAALGEAASEMVVGWWRLWWP